MHEETPSTYGTQRKAAARNRVAIIEAAHELFAQNPLVPLSEVAKHAGVGAGTLYRHFPTREDLILAAYQHDIERLTADASPDDEAWRSSLRVAVNELDDLEKPFAPDFDRARFTPTRDTYVRDVREAYPQVWD